MAKKMNLWEEAINELDYVMDYYEKPQGEYTAKSRLDEMVSQGEPYISLGRPNSAPRPWELVILWQTVIYFIPGRF